MIGAPALLAERAAHIDITTRRLKQLIAEGKQQADATIDETRVAYIRDLRAKAIVRTSKGSKLEDARGEALGIDIERKKLELAELQGDVVRVSVWREIARQVFTNIRTKLLTAPNKCAALVSPDVAPIVQETVKAVVHEALREIADEAVPKASADRGGAPRDSRVAGRSGQRSRA